MELWRLVLIWNRFNDDIVILSWYCNWMRPGGLGRGIVCFTCARRLHYCGQRLKCSCLFPKMRLQQFLSSICIPCPSRSTIPFSLNLGWLYDLLWPTECYGNGAVHSRIWALRGSWQLLSLFGLHLLLWWIPAQAPEWWETMWREGAQPSQCFSWAPRPQVNITEFQSVSKPWKTNKRTTQPAYRMVNNKTSLLLEATELWRSMWPSNEYLEC